ncbi:MAG: ribosome silencing factor [Candidatus Omnitrophica bacterium]|nr:ribosome silencing factor [Candidatus Omnitrophota bacterium]
MAKTASSTKRQSQQIAKKTIKLIAQLVLNKKAERLVILDIRKIANFCDYFVICSGTSDRQVKAIADGVQDGLKEAGLSTGNIQGYREGKWVIVDLGDIVVHVFEKANREFYGLEYLWQGGKEVKLGK